MYYIIENGVVFQLFIRNWVQAVQIQIMYASPSEKVLFSSWSSKKNMAAMANSCFWLAETLIKNLLLGNYNFKCFVSYYK
jgi:hypothetical protein